MIYVDDILLGCFDIRKITILKSFLDHQFKINDLGLVRYFLGLEIIAHASGYLMNQHKYVADLLEEFHYFNYSHITSPIDAFVKLTPDIGDSLPDFTSYRRLARKFNFLQHTRLDISFAMQHISQYLYHPCVPHMKVGLHVLRYIMTAPDQGIFLSFSPCLFILAYADSDWSACPLSMRSVTSYFIIFCTFSVS